MGWRTDSPNRPHMRAIRDGQTKRAARKWGSGPPAPGTSFTQCRPRHETMTSTDPGARGKCSSSPWTKCSRGRGRSGFAATPAS